MKRLVIRDYHIGRGVFEYEDSNGVEVIKKATIDFVPGTRTDVVTEIKLQ